MRVRRRTALLVVGILLCGVGLARASMPPGPDPAVREWPAWPYEAGCYGPPFDPVEVFSRPATAELGSRPGEVALREAINDPKYAGVGLSRGHWRPVTETEREAVFVTGLLSTPPKPWWTRFEHVGNAWKWAGSGNCIPHTTLHGLYAVPWRLDSRKPLPRKQATRLWIRLGPGPCSSGMSQNARARKPILRQIGKRLLMTIFLEPLPPGAYTCQGVIEPPLEVVLPHKLGPRRLYDGGTYPPGDVTDVWRESAERPRAVRR